LKFLRLKKEGIDIFQEFILSHKSETPAEFPEKLLLTNELTEIVGGDATELDLLDLDDRLSAAKQLDIIVSKLGLENAEKDVGFWTWCSVYLFSRLSKSKRGRKTPGESALWVLMANRYDRYYRHYLASIWFIYQKYKNNEEVLEPFFKGRNVNTPGDLYGQFASRQERITNETLLRVIRRLYWDSSKLSLKRGAGSKVNGGPRRLDQVLKQFNRTYDLFELSELQLFDMLPREFSRFK